MPTKLAVKTDVATFTRSTVRTYTHLVAVRGERAEVLEAERRRDHARAVEALADPTPLSDDSRAYWERNLARSSEPITADQGTWFAFAWCGRFDLALAQASKDDSHVYRGAGRYREVRIYDVVTGECRRTFTAPTTTPEAVQAARDAALAKARQRSRRRRW